MESGIQAKEASFRTTICPYLLLEVAIEIRHIVVICQLYMIILLQVRSYEYTLGTLHPNQARKAGSLNKC